VLEDTHFCSQLVGVGGPSGNGDIDGSSNEEPHAEKMPGGYFNICGEFFIRA
jgi:hypothetical protein